MGARRASYGRLRMAGVLVLGGLLYLTFQWRLAPILMSDGGRTHGGESLALLRRLPGAPYTVSADGPCAAGGTRSPVAAVASAPSAEEAARLAHMMQSPPLRNARTVRALLDAAKALAVGGTVSVTVVLEYVDAARLCRQLSALAQQTAAAEGIWVSALHDPDGDDGAEARRVVASHTSGVAGTPVELISTTTVHHGTPNPSAAPARLGGRLTRFQLALQASSQHVLVLDASLVPPPAMLATLVRLASLPEGQGLLGVSGWRTMPRMSHESHANATADYLGASNGDDGVAAMVACVLDESDAPCDEDLYGAVGEASVSVPASGGAHARPLDRVVPVDVLRGAWFIRTRWLGTLFKEAPPCQTHHPHSQRAAGSDGGRSVTSAGCGGGGLAPARPSTEPPLGNDPPTEDPVGEEAWLSVAFRRHAGLPSLVVPMMDASTSRMVSNLPRSWTDEILRALQLDRPTPQQEKVWRAHLWRSVRRGDLIPGWRDVERPTIDDASRGMGSHGALRTRGTPLAASANDANAAAAAISDGAGEGAAPEAPVAEPSDGAAEAGAGNAFAGAEPARVVLLVVSDLNAARSLAVLHSAFTAQRARYDVRLLIAPGVGGCAAVSAVMSSLDRSSCRRASAVYQLRGQLADTGSTGFASVGHTPLAEGGEGWFDRAAATAAAAGDCSEVQVEIDSIVLAARPVLIIAPSLGLPGGAGRESERGADPQRRPESSACPSSGEHPASDDASHAVTDVQAQHAVLAEALRAASDAHGVVLIEPPRAELGLLEWLAVMPPSALLRWHEPLVEIAIITHRRPASLRRLLRSLRCAHHLGDEIAVTISVEHGADDETLRLARTWPWPHGARRVFRRVVRGGLIAAVVDSWYPSSNHSYGLLLEDDIEVSPFYYVYLKLLLMRHVYADAADGGNGGHMLPSVLGISLYTPRLVELTMPRRHIDLFQVLGPSSERAVAAAAAAAIPTGDGGGRGHLFLQQLPCSWGQLFFPAHWREFHSYMRRRVHEGAAEVQIPHSACCPGWSTSWKKFLIELCFLRGYVVLYPNFANQTSLSTNHLEPGEHIQGKANKLKHRPIDFTVPLMRELQSLRSLWTAPLGMPTDLVGRSLDRPLALHSLPVLDLFSEPSTLEALAAKGAAAIARNPRLGAAVGEWPTIGTRLRGFFGGLF